MTIKGFLGSIGDRHIAGWAFDTAAPARHVVVEFILDTVVVGRATADIYRRDLDKAGYGGGDHGYGFTPAEPLDEAAQARLETWAITATGGRVALPRHQSQPAAAPAAVPVPVPAPIAPAIAGDGDDATSDPTQRPIFVFGATRSGTSAMVHALMRIERIRGFQEGHLIDLLGTLAGAARQFYQGRADHASAERNTMIAQVPIDVFDDGLDRMFIRLARQLFDQGSWIDKTPNAQIIRLAPRLKRLWPNSRFIFMRRRALENLASRARKFPTHSFPRGCEEWAAGMAAWTVVRERLGGSAIEIDQIYLARHGAEVAMELQDLLGLDALETRMVGETLARDHPQRTGESIDEALDIAALDWDVAHRSIFRSSCGPMMEAFGYTTDATYHRDGLEAAGIRRL